MSSRVQPAWMLPGTPSERAVAWTVDLDGNASTNSDRHLVVARWNAASGWSAPTFDLTSQLPAGAESPSLSFDPLTGLAHMAFVVRGMDGDGVTNTGVGNRSILWSANANIDKLWSGAQVKDGALTIFAEKPALQISNSGERLLLFRRFRRAGNQCGAGPISVVTGGSSRRIFIAALPDGCPH